MERITVRHTGGADVLTVRLPDHLERELDRLAASERTTKAQIVRDALERYVAAHREQRSSFELGEALFGRYGSGEQTLSTTYKERLREKLRAKHPG
jgi:predicted transcriptional regulator